jgi:hypothetical protein
MQLRVENSLPERKCEEHERDNCNPVRTAWSSGKPKSRAAAVMIAAFNTMKPQVSMSSTCHRSSAAATSSDMPTVRKKSPSKMPRKGWMSATT